MPTIPKYTKCSVLGCKNSKSRFNSFCMEHGGRDTYNHQRYNSDAERKARNEKYQTRQWQKLRQIQLSKQPLCQACLINNVVTPAKHIDHVFPWAQIDPSAFYHNLFQSLCVAHHSEKTALEQKGIYRHYASVIKDFTRDDYQRIRVQLGS